MWSRSVLHVPAHEPAIEVSVEEALVEESRRQQSLREPHRPSTTSHATGTSSNLGSEYSGVRKGRPRVPAAEATYERRSNTLDHTLEVLMHLDVLELHAVRVVHTPQGDERHLHLKVRVRCGQEELVVDVLVDMMEWMCVNGRFQGRRFASKRGGEAGPAAPRPSLAQTL